MSAAYVVQYAMAVPIAASLVAANIFSKVAASWLASVVIAAGAKVRKPGLNGGRRIKVPATVSVPMVSCFAPVSGLILLKFVATLSS